MGMIEKARLEGIGLSWAGWAFGEKGVEAYLSEARCWASVFVCGILTSNSAGRDLDCGRRAGGGAEGRDAGCSWCRVCFGMWGSTV